MEQDFRNVPVLQNGVGQEVSGDLAKAGGEGRFSSGAAYPALRIANQTQFRIDQVVLEQGADGQIGCRRITAGVRHQAGARDGIAIKLGKTVNRFGKKLGLAMRGAIPTVVIFGSLQPERPAQIDHTASGVQQRGCELHGNFRRRREKHNRQLSIPDGFGIEADAAGGRVSRVLGSFFRGLAMFEEQGFDGRVMRKQAYQLGSAIAAESGDTDTEVHLTNYSIL